MTDPERLFDADGSDLTRTMILAAREEAPSERALQRTLVALSAGAAVAGSSVAVGAAALGAGGGTAALVKTSAGTSMVALTVKWLGLGVLGGAMTVGAATGVERVLVARAPGTAPAVVARVGEPASAPAPRGIERAVAPDPARDEPLPAPPVAVRAPSAVAPAPAVLDTEASIAAEVAAIDRARATLAAGNAAGTLALLDAYQRRPAPRRLDQEALFLRMQAFSLSGNAVAAQNVARQLLDASPNGPHAQRARQLLGAVPEKK